MLSGVSPSLTRTGLGTTLFETSPSPIIRPACRRSVSSLCSRAALASSSTGLSRPLAPSSRAQTIINGIAASMQVTGMPSMTSMRQPVGKTWPVTEPQASRKSRWMGAAVPATPSMRASPSYVTARPGVRTVTSIRERVLTLNTRAVVVPSAAAIRPCSIANGTTPESMLPQFGRVSTERWPTPTWANR
jgi:hypothetical protein